MSGSERPSIEGITSPTTPPPELPDEFAKQETKYVLSMVDLTPAKQVIVIHEREIIRLERHCEMLVKDKEIIRVSHSEDRKTLDEITSKYLTLKQAHKDYRSTNGLAVLLTVLGGTLVSLAGTMQEGAWKISLSFGGIATFLCGFFFSMQSHKNNNPEHY